MLDPRSGAVQLGELEFIDVGATLPKAPSDLTVITKSASEINLRWKDNAYNESGFKIERKTGADGPYALITTVRDNVHDDFSTCTDSGLTAGTQYFYRVMATNPTGDSTASNEGNAIAGIGSVTREIWNNVDGYNVSEIPLQKTPDIIEYLSTFETMDNTIPYGCRIRGYLTAPSTGNYVFWLATNDGGELWLSTDDTVAGRQRIATSGWTNVRQWDKYPTQKALPIHLIAGKKYYIEVLYKGGGGGDSAAVGWAKPGQDTTKPSEVIPGTVLSPWL